jgi:hypothetical protein
MIRRIMIWSLLVEHDLFGKPVSTPHHARGGLFRIML